MSDFRMALSPLDEKRFGIRSMRASGVRLEHLPEMEAFCRDNDVKFAITRVRADQLHAVQQMEDSGYRLMDTLVYHIFNYGRTSLPELDARHKIRSYVEDDYKEVIDITTESFSGYKGHYHADPRLDQAKCDEVYIDWAVNSINSPDFADELIVVEGDEPGLKGYVTLRMNNPDDGECVLGGVKSNVRGQGIYSAMIIHGMHWCQQQNAKHMLVSTQITHIAVQKVWARLGFEFHNAYYTMHKWFA